jgi:aldehyde dehydrogenase (NAD+)
VDIAVAAARKAFNSPAWRGLAKADRGELIRKLADLVERDKLILATIEAWDNGKPYQDAIDIDITEVISVFRYYAGWADKVSGRTIETDDAKLAYTRHEPIGMESQPTP